MAKTKSLTDLSVPDLFQAVADSKAELFNLRFQLATGQLDNSTRMKLVKKDVARALTELRMREIAAAEALEAEAAMNEESA